MELKRKLMLMMIVKANTALEDILKGLLYNLNGENKHKFEYKKTVSLQFLTFLWYHSGSLQRTL